MQFTHRDTERQGPHSGTEEKSRSELKAKVEVGKRFWTEWRRTADWRGNRNACIVRVTQILERERCGPGGWEQQRNGGLAAGDGYGRAVWSSATCGRASDVGLDHAGGS